MEKEGWRRESEVGRKREVRRERWGKGDRYEERGGGREREGLFTLNTRNTGIRQPPLYNRFSSDIGRSYTGGSTVFVCLFSPKLIYLVFKFS